MKAPIDVQLTTEGNRLVGRDVFASGEVSCIKQTLGTYKSPEHAAVFGMILEDPRLLVAAAEGRITDEILDNAAAELRKRRHL